MEKADLVAARAGDLPVLPQVAAKVLEMVQNPTTITADLEKIITRDQAITAKILKIANSALYGLRCSVSTVSQAIVVVGMTTLRSLVLTASTEALFRSKTSRFKDKILWEHALAVALASRAVARVSGFPKPEEAFVAGLLHDVGSAVLDQNLGERYGEVVELVYNDGVSLVDAETRVLGIDHTQVGSLVVRKWNLAPPLEEAVRLHHEDPRVATLDPMLCTTVNFANALCQRIGVGVVRQPDLDLATLESYEMLSMDEDKVEEVTLFVQDRLAGEKELFGVA